MKIKFTHGTWDLVFVKPGSKCMEPDSDGECDPVEKRGRKRIFIAKGLSRKDRMETIIHEIIHAWDPQKSESSVEELGRVLTNALRRLGHK